MDDQNFNPFRGREQRPTGMLNSAGIAPGSGHGGQRAAPDDHTGDTAKNDFALKAPVISLPKGGGALRGMGEKFAANPVNGTASMTVPIATSPGRNGFGPQLQLSYSSGAGNGAFGMGWQLSVPDITRKTEKGLPQYQDAAESDVYLLSGAEDLVPVLDDAGARFVDSRLGPDYIVQRYRPRIEGLFARIERWIERTAGAVHWRLITRDNITHLYGRTGSSRIADPASPSTRTFSWLLCESYDNKGNAIVYEYSAEDDRNVDLKLASELRRQRNANRYLSRVLYGNRNPVSAPKHPGEDNLAGVEWLFEAVFDYDEGYLEPGGIGADGHVRIHASAQPRRPWSARPDPFSRYRAGFEVRTHRRCRRVLMFHHFDELTSTQGGAAYLVRSTDFDYADAAQWDGFGVEAELAHQGSTRFASFIQRVTQTTYQRDSSVPVVTAPSPVFPAGQVSVVTYLSRSLPPLAFQYSKARIQDDVRELDVESRELLPHGLDRDSRSNLPQGVDGNTYQFVDLDGEGLSGILTEQAGAWAYKSNRGNGSFGPLTVLPTKPSVSVASGTQQLMDLSGNGQLDVVAFDGPLPGFFERRYGDRPNGKTWAPFRAFDILPRLDFQNPNLRTVDLTGDGHGDILITEDDVLTWYPSLQTRGFNAAHHHRKPVHEDDGPRLVFSDRSESIHLADLSGDGLTDLVRIRNGEICYWPNLGYGKFGAKVVMDHAPRFDTADHFDSQRLRLADVDGSGTTDILYLHVEGVQIYFNQSGNRWTEARSIRHLPRPDRLSSVVLADLLGNGTACLVWSSPLPAHAHQPLRYIDLMGGQKPHLLVRTDNHLGTVTEVDYVPSTHFYLEDERAGRPWVTPLPFPVHCVARVRVTDKWRKTQFATTYSYHHGYYDGVEREFRGFGRVEQVDVENYGRFAQGNTTSPFITRDQTLYQPPTKTVTWFHTGALVGRWRVLKQYEEEYFPTRFFTNNPDRATVTGFSERALPEPDLDAATLSADEFREALRACKRMPLRVETYELDAKALELDQHVPVRLYSAAHHSCHIRRLQARSTQRHAVFLVTESEALNYHYELDLRGTAPLRPDPRVTHSLNLTVDAFGNVLQSVTVAYPRDRAALDADPALADRLLPAGTKERIQSMQTELHLVYSETRLTGSVPGRTEHSGLDARPLANVLGPAVDEVHGYRLPAPCEVQTFELSGLPLEQEASSTIGLAYFSLDDFRKLQLSDHYRGGQVAVQPIAYHRRPTAGTVQKRAVEHARHLFWADDLSAALPLGQLSVLGLPYESYKLALTDELVQTVLGGDGDWRLTPDTLDTLRSPSTSGYFSFANEAGRYWMRSGVAGFPADAKNHFYLPERYTDAFGNTTTLEFDSRYHLLLEQSTDPLGNVTAIEDFDYRVLAPRRLRDLNDNLTQTEFDLLGMPLAVAVMGKGDEGDFLDPVSLQTPPAGLPVKQSAQIFDGAFDLAQLRALLGTATSRLVYSFGESVAADGTIAYGQSPPAVCTIAREIHHAEGGSPPDLAVQVAYEYSDGGGNVLLKKVLAEPETAGGSLRFLTSGHTVLNNKGKPVKQYEPYFSATEQRFEIGEQVGVTAIVYYDAAGRVIRTEQPDGSYARVEFTPWQVRSFDQNDTLNAENNPWLSARQALVDGPDTRAAKAAAAQALRHAGTPTQVFVDSLGRDVVQLEHNRYPIALGARAGELVEEKYETFTRLDAEGKPLYIRDARGNLVMQYITPPLPHQASNPLLAENEQAFCPCYDIAGNLLMQHGMDGGARWMLHDAAGQPLFLWDENTLGSDADTPLERRTYAHQYDELRRPLGESLSKDGGPSILLQRFVYGDDGIGQRPFGTEGPAAVVNAKARNLRGKLYRHYDSSGLKTQESYDFKGAEVEVTRRLLADKTVAFVDWGPVRLVSNDEPDPAGRLERETYRCRTESDALGRMKRLFNWHSLPSDSLPSDSGTIDGVPNEGRPNDGVPNDGARNETAQARATVYLPVYNQRGALESETVHVGARVGTDWNFTTADEVILAVSGITYNAKGQRLTLRKGNGTLTRYQYDAQTFRLNAMRTTGEGLELDFPQSQSRLGEAGVFQRLYFAYDAVGNITRIYDGAHGATYASTGLVEPSSDYTYDALYRLIAASGREDATHVSLADGKMPALHRAPGKLRRYTQHYDYDSVGNIVRMAHRTGGNGEWTRRYEYHADSNRLRATWFRDDQSDRVNYDYDHHGSLLNFANVDEAFRPQWDVRDMIHRLNLGGGGEAHYQYGADKQRVRKLVRRNDGSGYEHIYLEGMEIRRELDAFDHVTERIETHHLFVDSERALLIEDIRQTNHRDLGVGVLCRYQYGNHLGSVGLELDATGRIISYEEYHPYGTTAYTLNDSQLRGDRKRYRYTGMERDEESGLSYHTARYYLPWLGRWGSVDPAGLVDGGNLYGYCRDSPGLANDATGLQSDSRLLGRLTQRFAGARTLTGGERASRLILFRYRPIFFNPALFIRDSRYDFAPASPGWDPVIGVDTSSPSFPVSPQERWDAAMQTGANISMGLFGALGYLYAGDGGAAYGANMDLLLLSFGPAAAREGPGMRAARMELTYLQSVGPGALNTPGSPWTYRQPDAHIPARPTVRRPMARPTDTVIFRGGGPQPHVHTPTTIYRRSIDSWDIEAVVRDQRLLATEGQQSNGSGNPEARAYVGHWSPGGNSRDQFLIEFTAPTPTGARLYHGGTGVYWTPDGQEPYVPIRITRIIGPDGTTTEFPVSPVALPPHH